MVEDGVGLPRDRVPRAPEPLRVVRLAWAGRWLRHVSRGVPRAVPRLGPAARGRARIDDWLDRPRLAADRRSADVAACSRAGESRDVTFLLGYTENPATAKFDPPTSRRPAIGRAQEVIERYRDAGQVDSDLAALRSEWDQRLGALQVATGDPHVDRMVNIWNPYQCFVTFNLSRSASMFESGIGRGMGFRDSNQDLLGFVHMAPERARARILDIAATQLPDGGAYHQYQPLTKRGNHDIGAGFNDDPAWLVIAVAAYVKETGDVAILEECAAWDNVEGSETPLHDHLRRCIDFTLARFGPHGLPLIGRADWNDCLNLNVFSEEPGDSFQTAPNRPGGVAESVFIAGLFVLAAREAAALACIRGDDGEAGRCRAAAASMTEAIEAHGWDGAWYRRAYDHAGRARRFGLERRGAHLHRAPGTDGDGGCRARGRPDARRRSHRSARELATEHGIALLQPAYSRYHVELGEISSYPPGYKENAGIFCHTNPWLMIGEAITGNGEGALDYYLRINPSAREAISDVHRCEPYVYAQMIAGPDAPTHGEAKNSWLTGTAAWNLVAISQWILGIRPEFDGLRVEPVIPAAWAGFHATRVFRGTDVRHRCRPRGPNVEWSREGRAHRGRSAGRWHARPTPAARDSARPCRRPLDLSEVGRDERPLAPPTPEHRPRNR